MYAVSEQFLTAIKNPNRKSTIYGTLTTTNGTQYPLNDSNIIKDSLYITNQIVNDNKLCFGAVYAGECGLIINSDINRYSLFGARIELNFSLDLEGGTIESIPVGVFFVDTPERIGSKIKLTAIDAMSNFDRDVDEDTNGTWYECVSYMATKCGVELAQTQEELEALHANATSQSYTIIQARISSCRDALSYFAAVICANATIDREGKLRFVQYATFACDANDRATRFSNCNFSDYTVKFSGLQMRFVAEENYAPYSAYGEESDGLILNCGDIPIVGGTPETKQATVDAMFQTLQEISYVPATLYISSNPAYELGDLITCEDVNNSNDSVNAYIMEYKFQYRQKELVHCYGENPLLQNVKDKQDRQAASFEAQLSQKNTVIVNYTNARAYTIKQEPRDIITLNYSVFEDCKPIVICTIPFMLDLDGYVEFSFYDGLVELSGEVYRGYYEAGEHFVTLMYPDNVEVNQRRSFRVLARCYADTTSAIRTQDARIKTLENGWELIKSGGDLSTAFVAPVDATEPTLTIREAHIKAVVYAQGINSGGAEWDGNLEFVDALGGVQVPGTGIIAFADVVSATTQTPTPAGLVELFPALSVPVPNIIGFSENVGSGGIPSFDEVITGAEISTENAAAYNYNSDYVSADASFALITEYQYTSAEAAVDSGRMTVVKAVTAGLKTVESVVVE